MTTSRKTTNPIEKRVPVGLVDPGAKYRYPAMPGWQHASFVPMLHRALLIGAGQVRNKLQRFILWGDLVAAGIADILSFANARLRGLLGRKSAGHQYNTLFLEAPATGPFKIALDNVNIEVTGDKKLMIICDVSVVLSNVTDVYFTITTGNRVVQDFSYASGGAARTFATSDTNYVQYSIVTEESNIKKGNHNYKINIHGTAAASASVRWASTGIYVTEV